jgi:hypothetical protein
VLCSLAHVYGPKRVCLGDPVRACGLAIARVCIYRACLCVHATSCVYVRCVQVYLCIDMRVFARQRAVRACVHAFLLLCVLMMRTYCACVCECLGVSTCVHVFSMYTRQHGCLCMCVCLCAYVCVGCASACVYAHRHATTALLLSLRHQTHQHLPHLPKHCYAICFCCCH